MSRTLLEAGTWFNYFLFMIVPGILWEAAKYFLFIIDFAPGSVIHSIYSVMTLMALITVSSQLLGFMFTSEEPSTHFTTPYFVASGVFWFFIPSFVMLYAPIRCSYFYSNDVAYTIIKNVYCLGSNIVFGNNAYDSALISVQFYQLWCSAFVWGLR